MAGRSKRKRKPSQKVKDNLEVQDDELTALDIAPCPLTPRKKPAKGRPHKSKLVSPESAVKKRLNRMTLEKEEWKMRYQAKFDEVKALQKQVKDLKKKVSKAEQDAVAAKDKALSKLGAIKVLKSSAHAANHELTRQLKDAWEEITTLKKNKKSLKAVKNKALKERREYKQKLNSHGGPGVRKS